MKKEINQIKDRPDIKHLTPRDLSHIKTHKEFNYVAEVAMLDKMDGN